MRHLLLLFFLPLAVLVVSCGDQPEPAETVEGNGIEEEAPQKAERPIGKHEVFRSELEIPFSDTAANDKFILSLYGDSLVNSVATFLILNASGDTLYKDTFDAFMLAGGEEHHGVAKAVAIRQRIRHFFDTENFARPNPKRFPYEAVVVDKAIYDEVMKRPQGRIFTYVIGYEDGRSVAYVPSRNKVEMIFNCC